MRCVLHSEAFMAYITYLNYSFLHKELYSYLVLQATRITQERLKVLLKQFSNAFYTVI